jgi:hypothetical protein
MNKELKFVSGIPKNITERRERLVPKEMFGVDISKERFAKYGIINSLDIREVLALASETRVNNYFPILDKIEKAEKGAVKVLHDFFGIVHFDSYGSGRMIRQHREMEKEGRFATIFSPFSDGNDAFLYQHRTENERAKNGYKKFQSESGVKIVRYFEVSCPEDLGKHLMRIRNKFGKISAFVLSGHGAQPPESFVEFNKFPKSDTQHEDYNGLMAEDLQSIREDQVDEFATKDCVAIVDSCYGGHEDSGFAMQLSRILKDRFVIAGNGTTDFIISRQPKMYGYPVRPPVVYFGRYAHCKIFLNGELFIDPKTETKIKSLRNKMESK